MPWHDPGHPPASPTPPGSLQALPARALAVATDLSVELAPFRPNAERQMWRFTEEGALEPSRRGRGWGGGSALVGHEG